MLVAWLLYYVSLKKAKIEPFDYDDFNVRL